MVELDNFDQAILTALEANARLSNLELAAKVPLSHSAISRRIKRLEEAGVIRGYRALVDPVASGRTVRAFVEVQRLSNISAVTIADALKTLPGITGCWIVSGNADILIEIAARDMQHFSSIMLNHVQTTAGVASTRSMFILDAVKDD